MLRGEIRFRAKIAEAGKGLKFPPVEFNPKKPGVDRVEIKSPKGNEILTAVHLAAVTDEEMAKSVASKVHSVALDRISFLHGIAIDKGKMIFSALHPVNPILDSVFSARGYGRRFRAKARPVIVLSDSSLKQKLEQESLVGEKNFGLFRSALSSESWVEKFMHLYNLLLMFFDDEQQGAQGRLDDFVRSENPRVQQTPHPRFPGVYESVYTRLRNEFGHHRRGVNLDQTMEEMKNNLGGLIALTKRAIELYS